MTSVTWQEASDLAQCRVCGRRRVAKHGYADLYFPPAARTDTCCMPELQAENPSTQDVLDVATRLRTVAVPLYRALRQHTGGRLNATQGSVLGCATPWPHSPDGPCGKGAVVPSDGEPDREGAVDEGLVQRESSTSDGRTSSISGDGQRDGVAAREPTEARSVPGRTPPAVGPRDMARVASALPSLERLIRLIERSGTCTPAVVCKPEWGSDDGDGAVESAAEV